MSKCVFITGGTKGIGKAVAACLAKSGYQLILTYAADQEAAINTQKELQAAWNNHQLHSYILLHFCIS